MICQLLQFCPIQLLLSEYWEILTIDWPTKCQNRDSRGDFAETQDIDGGQASLNSELCTSTLDHKEWLDTWKVGIIRAALEGKGGRIGSPRADELEEYGIRQTGVESGLMMCTTM